MKNSEYIANYSVKNEAFLAREERLFSGLLKYVDNLAGEYFSEGQIMALCELLKELRYRPENIPFSEELCTVIYNGDRIRNRYIPRKTLRKDEMAILLYNISPYALLNRIQTARFAKCAFPNFFSSVSTINSTFTKYLFPAGSNVPRSLPLQITNLDSHSTADLEDTLLSIASQTNT